VTAFGKCGYVCSRWEDAGGRCINVLCPLKQRGSNDNEIDMATRRRGNSKLVYDKKTRTIVKVWRPWWQRFFDWLKFWA